jgi:hypothetical protein
MNIDNRKDLNKAYELLEEAKALIEAVGEAEQEKFDNMSEGLQQTERGQRMEECASELADAASSIDDILSTVENAQG